MRARDLRLTAFLLGVSVVVASVGYCGFALLLYFAQRKMNRLTFDAVGLTTPSEGRYWAAGPGSRCATTCAPPHAC